jgi:cell division protein FtsL
MDGKTVLFFKNTYYLILAVVFINILYIFFKILKTNKNISSIRKKINSFRETEINENKKFEEEFLEKILSERNIKKEYFEYKEKDLNQEKGIV